MFPRDASIGGGGFPASCLLSSRYIHKGANWSAGALHPLVFRTSANARGQETDAGTSRSGGPPHRGSFADTGDDDLHIQAVTQRQSVQLDDSDEEQPKESLAGRSTQKEVNEVIKQKLC